MTHNPMPVSLLDSAKPLAVVTCGPAYSHIDAVRRITNFSTGEIGAILSRALRQAGWEVLCLRGEGSTAPEPEGVDVRAFSTNESLAALLQILPRNPNAIFHAAALCDFQVRSIDGAGGMKKIPTRDGVVTLHLEPAPKILPRLREWFSDALIVGWKYELDGDRAAALSKGAAQIRDCHTNACVVNGAAFGPGFGILLPDGRVLEEPDKTALAGALAGLRVPASDS
jgi:phosphopantothenoylcysteine decarboxylase/phosphopantothenate--cysteine ligase